MSEYQPQSGDYSIEKFDPKWKIRFEEAKELLQKTFATKALQIEHVGSTSVEGMSAKPVIDILVIIPNITDVAAEREQMQNLGYIYKENYIAGNSLFFCKDKDGVRVENIHVLPEGHPRIASFVDKRDYFRTHPDEVKRYEEVKRALAMQFPNDYRAYAKGKNDYLNRELVEKIAVWKRT